MRGHLFRETPGSARPAVALLVAIGVTYGATIASGIAGWTDLGVGLLVVFWVCVGILALVLCSLVARAWVERLYLYRSGITATAVVIGVYDKPRGDSGTARYIRFHYVVGGQSHVGEFPKSWRRPEPASGDMLTVIYDARDPGVGLVRGWRPR